MISSAVALAGTGLRAKATSHYVTDSLDNPDREISLRSRGSGKDIA